MGWVRSRLNIKSSLFISRNLGAVMRRSRLQNSHFPPIRKTRSVVSVKSTTVLQSRGETPQPKGKLDETLAWHAREKKRHVTPSSLIGQTVLVLPSSLLGHLHTALTSCVVSDPKRKSDGQQTNQKLCNSSSANVKLESYAYLRHSTN